MPPDSEISSCRSLVTPLVQLFPAPSPRSVHSLHLNHKYCRGARRMRFTKKKLIPLLILILTSISILRFLKLTIGNSSYSPLRSPVVAQKCQILPCNGTSPELQSRNVHTPFTTANNLTYKEFKFLSNLISHKAPCKLLIFGLKTQYLELASLNAGGYTAILEDDPQKLNEITVSSKATTIRIHKVEYHIPAGDAYKLLKYARLNPACATQSAVLQISSCQLALTKLPQEVYTKKWDVVMVDGPSGDRADAPGRMGTIYSASVLARATNITEVIVHDIDRMIEKWFSWEFLSDDNLVSSKGRFWHFRIVKQPNITRS